MNDIWRDWRGSLIVLFIFYVGIPFGVTALVSLLR